MENKTYSFAGVTVEIRSERKIENGTFFEAFYAPGDAPDFTVELRTGTLPERSGQVLYQSEKAVMTGQNGKKTLFSCYPKAYSEIKKDYAASTKNGDRILLTVDHGDLWDSMVMRAINIPGLMLEKGSALLHASFVIYNGCALLFTGKSGAGKTTQAELWQKFRGADVINADRAALRFNNGMLYACGVPFCGSSAVALNKCAPVKAIVSLVQSEKNDIRRADALGGFCSVLNGMTYEPRSEEESRLATALALKAAETGMIYTMECRKDESAVAALEQVLWKTR